MNIKVFRIAKPPLKGLGTFVFFSLMALSSMILAPIFFIVFIFYSKQYIDGAVEGIIRATEENT